MAGERPSRSAAVEALLDDLAPLGEARARAMFGGHGVYVEGTFVGMVWRERVFFRVDDRTRPRYERAGTKPFRPSADFEAKNYYEVPAEVLSDARALRRWARDAARAAIAAKAVRARR